MDDLARRFNVDGTAAWDAYTQVGNLRNAYMEEKGNGARVIQTDDKILKILIPALPRIPTDQLEAHTLACLRRTLGDAKTEEVWGDATARSFLLRHAADDLLYCDAIYTFTKTREEEIPNNRGELGLAAFDMDVVFDPTRLGATIPPAALEATVHAFTYKAAGKCDFGWNAVSKAPLGFFSSRPIGGVDSRPGPATHVIGNLDTGTIEIRNRQYPGSKEYVRDGKQVDATEAGAVPK